MTPLPIWAQSPAATALLEQIKRDPPAFTVSEYASSGGVETRRYEGATAAKLRRLCDETANRLFDEAEAAFERGVPWEEAAADANACLAMSADKVIAAVLDEAIQPARHVLTDRIVGKEAA